MQLGQAFAIQSGQARLVFLVGDPIEAPMQEDREVFSPAGKGGDVIGAAAGYLRNVIRGVHHIWGDTAPAL